MSSSVATIEGRIDRQTAGTLAVTNDAGGMKFETMVQVMEFAKMMAVADIAVPPHLRGNPGACLAVALQAVEWNFSPFAVANKSYSVNNRLAYESQLVQAVILQRAPIKGRFNVEYIGEGGKRRCKITAELLDGGEVEYISPEFDRIQPKNSPLWKSDPDQQQFYMAGRALCRRHFPDVLLGVYAKDELEDSPKDITPKGSGLADRLQAGQGGFSAEGVEATLANATEAKDDDPTDTQDEDASPATDQPATGTIDWNDAIQVAAALDAGKLPDGFTVRDDGTLVIPDAQLGEKDRPRGHSMLAASYDEIVTVSGKVVKSRNRDPEPRHDPEVMRAGAQAFIDGEERRAPEDFGPAECVSWLKGYDATAKQQQAAE